MRRALPEDNRANRRSHAFRWLQPVVLIFTVFVTKFVLQRFYLNFHFCSGTFSKKWRESTRRLDHKTKRTCDILTRYILSKKYIFLLKYFVLTFREKYPDDGFCPKIILFPYNLWYSSPQKALFGDISPDKVCEAQVAGSLLFPDKQTLWQWHWPWWRISIKVVDQDYNLLRTANAGKRNGKGHTEGNFPQKPCLGHIRGGGESCTLCNRDLKGNSLSLSNLCCVYFVACTNSPYMVLSSWKSYIYTFKRNCSLHWNWISYFQKEKKTCQTQTDFRSLLNP